MAFGLGECFDLLIPCKTQLGMVAGYTTSKYILGAAAAAAAPLLIRY